MTGAGCREGWGTDDGPLSPPAAAPEGVPAGPAPEADPGVEPVPTDAPFVVELPPAGVGDTPVDGAVPVEATGAVECPGRAWLK